MKRSQIFEPIQLIFLFLIFLISLSIPTYSDTENDVMVNRHRAMILDLSSRNKSGNTELIALKHCFDIFAIQYTVTDKITTAAASPLIFTAGDLRNTTFSPAELQQLYEYVENGGVLVSQVVIGNKLFSLFGIKDLDESKKRYTINFQKSSIDSSLLYLDRPEEQTVSLGNKKLFTSTIWTHAFSVAEAKVLASTEDKKTIFSVNQYGDGFAYVLGVSLSDSVLLPHVGNDYEAQRGWINTFEPGSDVFILIMKSIYEQFNSLAIYPSTIPYGKSTALILSHDVDAQNSFKNMVDYAELEKRFGVSGTYFITTKYFNDDMDIGYYDAGRIEYIKQVKQLGGDIASHTVSHSVIFEKFPVGTSNVTSVNYKIIKNPTVFGEVKVSKELLDRDIPSQKTISFRSGYLRYPDNLIDALEKSGYLYDSSFSANDIMCNYAFKAFKFRKVGSEESSIIEIPVIFDDSQGLLTPRNVNELVARWVDIIKANGDNEAISGLLIHPSETGYKLKAEENLLTQISRENIWMGNVTAYGNFWAARNRYNFESRVDGTNLTIKILSPEIDERISICIKNNALIKKIHVIDFNNNQIQFTRNQKKEKLYLHFNSN